MKKTFFKLGMGLTLGAAMFATSCSDDDSEPTTVTRVDTVTVTNNTTDTITNTVTEVVVEAGETICGSQYQTVLVKASAGGVGTTTWTKDKVYILDGFVFVNDGQTLTIEAGTIVKGNYGTGAEASALIVAQGGKIMAEGTADMPIIFTSVADETNRDTDGNLCEGANLNESAVGLWGGVIVLGKSSLNVTAGGGGTASIEGIPTSEPRGVYGGSNDNDNSGVLKYISIRHGGSNIGADNEINGLTLGGVGSATEIDYVEVFANQDDGIEWFGGTANVKHAVVAHCGDDSFDYDEGWSGKAQFMLTVQGDESDRGGEHDGGPKACETCEPYAIPEFRNVTYIAADGSGSRALTFRDNAGGKYYNAIFAGFEKGIDVEDLASGGDSKQQLADGNLVLDNISFDDVSGNYVTYLNYASGDAVVEDASSMASNVETNASTGVTAANPVGNAPAGATLGGDDFFDAASYRGAFDGSNWAQGWTKLYK